MDDPRRKLRICENGSWEADGLGSVSDYRHESNKKWSRSKRFVIALPKHIELANVFANFARNRRWVYFFFFVLSVLRFTVTSLNFRFNKRIHKGRRSGVFVFRVDGKRIGWRWFGSDWDIGHKTVGKVPNVCIYMYLYVCMWLKRRRRWTMRVLYVIQETERLCWS